MYPEDRVLVGVIRRKKDFKLAQEEGWYRIPQGQAPKGIHAEYIAFFFSRAFGEQNGGIHYYARRTGLELATRAELLPAEANHARAAEVYHKVQFQEVLEKKPPVLNVKKRRFAFIYTTWDRFVHATTLDDLYSRADYLVDRVYYALREAGFRPERFWEQAAPYPLQQARVRVLCEDGEVVASPAESEGIVIDDDTGAAVRAIREEVEKRGGPRMISIPIEY